jgi:L-ascorbate metabolism protein UlaG (beta-lactamase superfamily)
VNRLLVAAFLPLASLWLLAACYPKWKGPRTDHFDGKHFTNHPQQPTKGEFLKWRRGKNRGYWPDWVTQAAGPKPPAQVQCDDMRVTFVNHNTMLLQTAGLNILTDPIWSERASPVKGAGPKRHRTPGIRFDDLPKIHLVLVSHNHYDAMDRDTLEKLSARHHPKIVVPLGNRDWLIDKGVVGVHEIDWWQSIPVTEQVKVMGVPAQHKSGRGLTDRDRALWQGYVVETPCGKIYFAGDTGMSEHFKKINEKVGPVRLALLPIGGYEPQWYMKLNHLNPTEAVEAHKIVQAQTTVAFHFGTFEVADGGLVDPLIELNKIMPPEIRPNFWVLNEGEAAMIPAMGAAPSDAAQGDGLISGNPDETKPRRKRAKKKATEDAPPAE